MNLASDDLFPKPPTFSDELIEQCTNSYDFRPILFEWYKFVGALCNTVACISPDSPALRKIPSVHYAVLIGLLNRCSRLMLANVRLSATRKYGETTRLLDRSISETAIKVQWLCHKNNLDSFVRYLADGLKTDLLLKKHIENNIRNRNGNILVIEKRMLESIQESFSLSGLTEQDVNDAKGFPDFAQICKDLEISEFFYIAIQKMGSQSVHGTWSDLVSNYLRHDNAQRLSPRDHEIETQDVQFITVMRLVLSTMKKFLAYVVSDPSDKNEFISGLKEIDEKLIEIQSLSWGSDFEIG